MEKEPKSPGVPAGTDSDVAPQPDTGASKPPAGDQAREATEQPEVRSLDADNPIYPEINAPGMTGAALGVDSMAEAVPAAQNPAAEPAPTSTRPAAGLADIIYGILAQPQQTFQELARNPRPWWGIVTMLVLSWVSGFAGVRAMTARLAPVAGRIVASGGGGVGAALGLALAGLVFWLAGVGTTHLSAEIFGGRGSVIALIGSYGLANLPQVFLIPISILISPGKSGAFWGYGFLWLGVTIWVLVLHTYAVKHNYKLSGGMAFAAVILPTVAFVAAFLSAIIGVLGLIGPVIGEFPGRLPLR